MNAEPLACSLALDVMAVGRVRAKPSALSLPATAGRDEWHQVKVVEHWDLKMADPNGG
jgi:hypothetical protein